MADEVTATTAAPAEATTATPESTPVVVDHVAEVNKALDAARDAMVAGGMSEGDAEAFINSARPSGMSTAVGNLADLQRSSGLTEVMAEPVSEDRLAFAHKIDKDVPVPEPTPARAAELKASSDAAAAAEEAKK